MGPTTIITVPSEARLGVQLTLDQRSAGSGWFGFGSAPPASSTKGRYPRVLRVEPTSAAHAAGLRAGHELVALNGHSLGGRDADTVRSDFAYEKRCGPTLSLEFR